MRKTKAKRVRIAPAFDLRFNMVLPRKDYEAWQRCAEATGFDSVSGWIRSLAKKATQGA